MDGKIVQKSGSSGLGYWFKVNTIVDMSYGNSRGQKRELAFVQPYYY